jgi:hypothetical protein
MKTRLLALSAPIASIVLVLSSCGGGDGGGGSDGPVPSTLAFPVAAAVSAYVQTSQSFTLNGTDNVTSNTYTFTHSSTPGSASTFESQPAQTAAVSVVLKRNGVTISTGSGTEYFQVNPYKPLGRISTSGEYEVATSWTALPTTAMVGQTGPAWSSTEYTNSSKTTVESTDVVTWSLEADTANTAWLCLNFSTTFTSGDPNFIEADCYRIDGSGNVLGQKATLAQDGVVISFR